MNHIITAFTHAVLVDSAHTVIITDNSGLCLCFEGVFLDDGELVLYDPQIHT
ncbi:hypothetical protein M422DRAFT_25888 [Sphaerobolus stellatus SS14]|nr:hypothetical protein M422DRAFT_25888 [Sphaerobolus stellatus SS14]